MKHSGTIPCTSINYTFNLIRHLYAINFSSCKHFAWAFNRIFFFCWGVFRLWMEIDGKHLRTLCLCGDFYLTLSLKNLLFFINIIIAEFLKLKSWSLFLVYIPQVRVNTLKFDSHHILLLTTNCHETKKYSYQLMPYYFHIRKIKKLSIMWSQKFLQLFITVHICLQHVMDNLKT